MEEIKERLKMALINWADTKSRIITYLGGLGVSFSSVQSQAAPTSSVESIDLLQIPLSVNFTLGNLTTLLGCLVIVFRFLFDVWKYFDQRKNKQQPTSD